MSTASTWSTPVPVRRGTSRSCGSTEAPTDDQWRASGSQRPGKNNAELTNLAAGLMALRERACATDASLQRDDPTRSDAINGDAPFPESEAATGQLPPSRRPQDEL